MSSSYHDPSSPHYNPFSEEQSTGGSSLSSSDKRDKRTPTQVHNPPLTYNTQHPSFAEAVGSGRLLSGAGPTGAFVPPTLPPQAQAQQQQASIQHAFFPSSLNQPPLSYDEKAPLTSESVPVITMQDYDQAGNFRQQQQYGVGQQRTSQGLPPLANLFEDTTPYGRVRHQLIESYSNFQRLLDRSIPFVAQRWAVFGVFFVLFWWRILSLQGFYVVAYALSIYQLNLFLLFLTPKFLEDLPDPWESEDDEEQSKHRGGSSLLPTNADDEFRPFIRRLPEFKFWWGLFKSLLYAIGATFFDAFDIPVFWPILLVYFIALFVFTMRRQIEHMIAHRYIPFDFGKKRFTTAHGGNLGQRSRL